MGRGRRLVALCALCYCLLALSVKSQSVDEGEASVGNSTIGNDTKLIASVNASAIDVASSHLALPPQPDKAEPIKVFVGYYVQSVGSLDQQSMTYSMDIYFRMSWTNPKAAKNRSGVVSIKPNVAKDMWLPDIYFINEKEAAYHTIVQPSASVYLAPDGTVAWSIRITLKLSCNLDLRSYPLDKQTLSLQIASYALPTDVMQVEWFSERPIKLNPILGMSDFEITGFHADHCEAEFEYLVTEAGTSTASFSCLEGKLYLERYIRYYLVKDIFPQGLIVMTSWVSFWIDKTAAPARIALSFTTLLTMTTMGGNMYATLPRVSYSKAIDYWYGACLVFVVCALVEYALVNDSLRRGKRYAEIAAGGAGRRRRATIVDREQPLTETEPQPKRQNVLGSMVDGGDPIAAHFNELSDRSANRASLIDKVSRVVFPVAFGVFCLIFWLSLLL